jgi:hypothetical protein
MPTGVNLAASRARTAGAVGAASATVIAQSGRFLYQLNGEVTADTGLFAARRSQTTASCFQFGGSCADGLTSAGIGSSQQIAVRLAPVTEPSWNRLALTIPFPPQ